MRHDGIVNGILNVEAVRNPRRIELEMPGRVLCGGSCEGASGEWFVGQSTVVRQRRPRRLLQNE
jgi:hypothetical protein